jgi:hypothetical protein
VYLYRKGLKLVSQSKQNKQVKAKRGGVVNLRMILYFAKGGGIVLALSICHTFSIWNLIVVLDS